MHGLYESPQVQVRGQVSLQDRHAMFLGSQPAGAEHSERPWGNAISEIGPFHQVVVGEAMERPRQLFGMDAKPASEPLEGDARGGVLGQELQDLAIVLPQV